MLTNRKYSGRRPLVVVAALLSLMVLLPLAGCKTEVDTSSGSSQQEQTGGNSGNSGGGNTQQPGGDNTGNGGNNSGGEDEVGGEKPVTYTVTFNMNAEDATGEMASQTFIEGVEQELSANQFKRDTWTFSGWSEDKAATAATWGDKAKFTATKDTTLYAVWTPVYTVTFDADGGTFADGKGPKTETVESGKNATKPDDPTKTGYNFDGWYTSPDDGTTLADTAYSFDTPIDGDLTLHAAWNGRDSDGNIVLRNKVIPKTSEVQVLSETVTFASLYNGDSGSKVFVEDREGAIDPFVMGQYEVTQQLYLAVMGAWGSTSPAEQRSDTYGVGDEYPAYYVSWYDTVVFCNELSQLMGLEPAYSKGGQTDTSTWGEVPTSSNADWNAITCNWDASGYRLPTEAEWELAARGGNPEAEAWKYTYAGSNTIDEVAWYTDNSGNKTHQVGGKAANSLNLHDMSGNVREWCWDWYGSISAGTLPSGGASGSLRVAVARGGGWNNDADYCAVSRRSNENPYIRNLFLGFRVVRPSSK